MKVLLLASRSLAVIILAGAILYGMFKLGQVLYKGIKADFTKEKK